MRSIACGALLVVTTLSAQSPSLEWNVGSDVTLDDRKAILEIARTMGIERPRRVWSAPVTPTACVAVEVFSDTTIKGNRLTWTVARVASEDPDCVPNQTRSLRNGRWAAWGDAYQDERWRVRDGSWQIDIRLGEGVSYADAERIVHAIRRKQIVNGLIPREFQPGIPLPDIDPDAIRSILKSDDGGRGYSVYTGAGLSGEIFTFRIARGRVELYAVGAWIV